MSELYVHTLSPGFRCKRNIIYHVTESMVRLKSVLSRRCCHYNVVHDMLLYVVGSKRLRHRYYTFVLFRVIFPNVPHKKRYANSNCKGEEEVVYMVL